MQFAQIILPLPLEGVFTYHLPPDLGETAKIGCRAIIPFGNRKIYTGLIIALQEESSIPVHSLREVIDVIDDTPVMTDMQLKFIKWMSAYYMAPIGDVYNAALPAGLKMTSESYVSLLDQAPIDQIALNDNEHMIVEILMNQEVSVDEIRKLTGLKHPYRLVKNLREKGFISLHEKLKDRYSPKKETRIRLTDHFTNPDQLEVIMSQLESKPKQLDVLLAYLRHVPVLEEPGVNQKGILKKELIASGVSTSSIKTLVKNEILESWEQVIDRFAFESEKEVIIPDLSQIQQLALQQVQASWEKNSTTLLKGITGSGKTEIYIHLIQEMLSQGKRALYLLPEIALTTQIIQRFRKFFGNRFGVYHSRFSDNERTEIYNNCLAGKYDFIVGVRSSVFLPIKNLGLIIIDEEHEHSYKQYDPAPRYHARDAALYLGKLSESKVLLGSATPSLESYYNAQEGKFGYVTLEERYDNQPLPELELVDMSKARKQRRIKGSFSDDLLIELDAALSRQKQVILFQNRRGYSPFVQCDNCFHIPTCPNCSVSLTYHIYQNQLICHYCGFKQYHDSACESCQSKEVKTVGIGTEQIEEELSLMRPDLVIQRMDLDTTRNKYAYQDIIDRFENEEIQVLVGTQMVTKGLDFEHVSLVGVFDTDRLIHFPDFRSHERAFQMITQVSGRSGRKHERGKVLIQTNEPDHPILQHIREGHLDLFYQDELIERQRFKYPPFYRLIKIVVRHKDKNTSAQAANRLQLLIRGQLGDGRTLGPIEPVLSKLRNYYIYEIMIKIEKNTMNLVTLKEFLKACRDTLLALPSFKSVLIHFDVDPL